MAIYFAYIQQMNYKDLFISIGLLLVVILGFMPALNNFKVVLNEKTGNRISRGMRSFLLLWFGLGLLCIVLTFLLSAYWIWIEIEKVS